MALPGPPRQQFPQATTKPFSSMLETIAVLLSLEGQVSQGEADPVLACSSLQNMWGYLPGTHELGTEGIKT